jgi:hypothetical protein
MKKKLLSQSLIRINEKAERNDGGTLKELTDGGLPNTLEPKLSAAGV